MSNLNAGVRTRGLAVLAGIVAVVATVGPSTASDTPFSPFSNSSGSARSISRDTSLSSSGGGTITWLASSGCVPSGLRQVLSEVAAEFGPVTVNSTCRSRHHNRVVGGARHSYHLTGEAVDFRVRSGGRGVYAFLASKGSVGGLKHYGGGLFHIDTGPRRSW